jgi:hypothetical protein
VVLATGGRRVVLTLPDEYEPFLRAPHYRPFYAADGRSDAWVRFHLVEKPGRDAASSARAAVRGHLFDSLPILSCPIVTERYLSRGAGELLILNTALADFLRPSTWTMDAFAFGFPTADVSQYLRGRLFVLLGTLLTASEGVLLHGSGFVIDGLAAAVIGPSEAGKTTAARLVQGDRLLSDDVVAVTDLDGEPQLHATPFGRESDGVGSAPLRAIFFPRKQAAFSLQPLTARQALIRSATEQADTLQGLFHPYGGMAIRNLGRLFRKVPAYELGFSLEGIDRDAIRRVLSGS